MQFKYHEPITVTYGLLKDTQNTCYAEGILAAAKWLNENGQELVASKMLLALIDHKPYEVPSE